MKSPSFFFFKKKKERKSAYNFFYDSTTKSTSNGSDTVLLKCSHPSQPGASCIKERVESPPLPRHQKTDGVITAERQRQLVQVSQVSWQQQSRVSLPEVPGVKGLALKKSLTSYWRY